jgi:hypothetical protein
MLNESFKYELIFILEKGNEECDLRELSFEQDF